MKKVMILILLIFWCGVPQASTGVGTGGDSLDRLMTSARYSLVETLKRIRLGQDVEHLRVIFTGDAVAVEIMPTEDRRLNFDMDSMSPLRNPLRAKFGRHSRVKRKAWGEIPRGVLPEISAFLGFDVEEDAVA